MENLTNNVQDKGRSTIPLGIAAIAVALTLCAANLLLGPLNQDEGWYLYAGKMVTHGQWPYVDFAATQGPLMYLFYAAATPLVEMAGLAGGRLFTALLGLLSLACASALAAALVDKENRKYAVLAAFILSGVNVYQSYFTVIVKTYALTALLLTSAFLALSKALPENGNPRPLILASAGMLLAAAASVRFSAAFVIPVVFFVLYRAFRYRALFLLAGSLSVFAILWLPFAVTAFPAVKFAVFDYHAARVSGSLFSSMAYKAGFVSRSVGAYFTAFSILALLLAFSFIHRKGNHAGPGSHRLFLMRQCIWLSLLAVTIVHLAAPFPYDDYQVFIYPLFAAALAGWIFSIQMPEKYKGMFVAMLLLLCSAASFSSPLNESWFLLKRDRLWWPIRRESQLAQLRKTADAIRMIQPHGEIFTQDTYIAVEAGLSVPPGFELGPFSYFPDWPDDKAAACHVLNRKMMLAAISGSRAPIAAMSGYAFAVESPAGIELSLEEQAILWSAFKNRYSFFREIPDFGQANTTLGLYLAK